MSEQPAADKDMILICRCSCTEKDVGREKEFIWFTLVNKACWGLKGWILCAWGAGICELLKIGIIESRGEEAVMSAITSKPTLWTNHFLLLNLKSLRAFHRYHNLVRTCCKRESEKEVVRIACNIPWRPSFSGVRQSARSGGSAKNQTDLAKSHSKKKMEIIFNLTTHLACLVNVIA